jgi:hypothetical protein
MNIDSLLNLNAGVYVHVPGGGKVPGTVAEILGEDHFLFSPGGTLDAAEGATVKISDGQDTVLARVVEITGRGIRMCIDSYAASGSEPRQDVRIYDKIYFRAEFLCNRDRRAEVLPGALERIRSNKLIIDSFLKGKYGYPGADEEPYTRESPFNQAVWEINASSTCSFTVSAEDFMELMETSPRDVNIAPPASGSFPPSVREGRSSGDPAHFPMVPLLSSAS